jgi:DNA-binding Xre family transcriptional regulator
MAISYKPLFRLLVERDMKKTDLVEACNITLPVIAKFSKGELVAMSVLCKLCEYFKCQMSDIVEYVPEGGAEAE